MNDLEVKVTELEKSVVKFLVKVFRGKMQLGKLCCTATTDVLILT